MASDNVLKMRIKSALEGIASAQCACGTPGERWVRLEWQEASRVVSVEIECRACQRVGVAGVNLSDVPGTNGGA